MGSVWLGSLPQVLRDAGLLVEEWPGWEWRSRSSGGYTDVRAVGVHHDANRTGTSLEARCRSAWEATWNTNRPVGALWLHTDGRWVVGAAGATNTQGRGPALRTSRGVIPENQGNTHTLSIEASNNGVGERWPAVQQTAYVAGCRALIDWLGLLPSDIFAHFETAPGRKIDPAGPSKFAPNGGSWDMDVFRLAVTNTKENDVTPIDSKRIMDTRWNGWSKMKPGTRHEFGLDLAAEVPASAYAAFVNITTLNSVGEGHVSVARPGEPIGATSVLNPAPGIVKSNMVLVPVRNRKFSIQVWNTTTDLFCDVLGYV